LADEPHPNGIRRSIAAQVAPAAPAREKVRTATAPGI
jgi:hypothetical protein